jgi:hypothetical protein
VRCVICGDLLPKARQFDPNCQLCSQWAHRLFEKFHRIKQLREIHERLHQAPEPVRFNIAEDHVVNAMVQSIAEEV